jgi:hypothetical protein
MGMGVFVFVSNAWCINNESYFIGGCMREFMDKLVSYRPFLDAVLQIFFWLVMIVATLTKDYENMAIAAWWIIFLELVLINDNLKALKKEKDESWFDE